MNSSLKLVGEVFCWAGRPDWAGSLGGSGADARSDRAKKTAEAKRAADVAVISSSDGGAEAEADQGSDDDVAAAIGCRIHAGIAVISRARALHSARVGTRKLG